VIQSMIALTSCDLNVEGPLDGAARLRSLCRDVSRPKTYPVKLLAGRNSAALSIGSGLLFSSVDHGSAFDIAGHSVVEPEAVLPSIQLLDGAFHLGRRSHDVHGLG
jgi:hypothetical protein